MISLQVGKRYVMRNGEVTEPITLDPNPDSFFKFKGGGNFYGSNGCYWSNGDESPYDIISEFSEPAATEVRRDWADEMDRTWEKGRV